MGGMKSFRSSVRPEPRKFGNVTIITSMLICLCIISLVKSHYGPSNAGRSEAPMPLQFKTSISGDMKLVTNDVIEDKDREGIAINQGNAAIEATKPICFETSRRSDTCEAEGDVRVQGSSNTVFINPSTTPQEWKIKPYARKTDAAALAHVKEWSIKPLRNSPACTHNYSVPAFVFSVGGFTGNFFHDFTDVLIPVFITSYQFHGEVQFLVSDANSWWINKFILIFRHLSNYEIINTDGDDEETIRCFGRVTLGPTFHKVLGIDASKTPNAYSMFDFKVLLRSSLGLQRSTAMAEGSGAEARVRVRPRLLIIQRKKSRAFMNVHGMVAMATSVGFDVRVGEPGVGMDVSKFARLVNSADVMVGVLGAGLANMVFLPEGAVVVQVIPFGGLEWLARDNFKEPTKGMGLSYLEYVVREEESSLKEQYPSEDAVLRDPASVHKQGWDAIRDVYLEKQNVRPHLGGLRDTLLEAIKLLPQTSSDSR